MITCRARDREEEENYSKSKTELIIDAAGDTAKATGRFAGKVFKTIMWTSISIIVIFGVVSGVVYYKVKNERDFQMDLYNAFNDVDYQNSKNRNRIDQFMNSIKKNGQINCLSAKELIIQMEEDEFMCGKSNFHIFKKFKECVQNALTYQKNNTTDNLSIFTNSLNTLKASNKGLGEIIEGWHENINQKTQS